MIVYELMLAVFHTGLCEHHHRPSDGSITRETSLHLVGEEKASHLPRVYQDVLAFETLMSEAVNVWSWSYASIAGLFLPSQRGKSGGCSIASARLQRSVWNGK